jgi:hypothetical protein
MPVVRRCLSLLLLLSSPVAAQSLASRQATAAAKEDEAPRELPFLFGVAGGALSYEGGRQEQSVGAVVRWVAAPWLSISATPTMSRVRDVTVSTAGPVQPVSGMVDLPIDATLSHAFKAPWSPGVAATLGVSLPTGDTARGFGMGEVGYSASTGLGFSPAERVWVHLGAGRSLSGVTMQSAFSSGSGWGDASAGVSLSERFSLNGGYSTDIGAVDSTTGHSTSLNGGFSLDLRGRTSLNLNASRGLSGLAPRWSFALGLGTAFPYLNHLGAGSPIDQLRETFAGGTHGLGNGGGSGGGSGNAGGNGKGKGRTKL